jgi:hypothetical protein
MVSLLQNCTDFCRDPMMQHSPTSIIRSGSTNTAARAVDHPSIFISVAQPTCTRHSRADPRAVLADFRHHLTVYSLLRPIRSHGTPPAMLYYFHGRPVGLLLYNADAQWLAKRPTRAILISSACASATTAINSCSDAASHEHPCPSLCVQ